MGPFFKVPNGGHFKYEVDELISQVSETLKEFEILTPLSVPPLPARFQCDKQDGGGVKKTNRKTCIL